jgi:hypothetical protein
MELLIRIVGIGAAMRLTGKMLALAAEVRMTLIEVEQSSKGRVKQAGRYIFPLPGFFCQKASRLITIETPRKENFSIAPSFWPHLHIY